VYILSSSSLNLVRLGVDLYSSCFFYGDVVVCVVSSGEESGKFRINLSTIVCLIGDLSAAVVLDGMNGEIFCFLPSSSAIAGVGGV
jgi:hypothetical protein